MSSETTPLVESKKQAFRLMEWLSDQPEFVRPEILATQITGLLALSLQPRQKLHLLEALFAKLNGGAGLDASIAQFVGVRTPLSNSVYQRIQMFLNLIDDFAQGFEEVLPALPADASNPETGLCLERILFFLYKHQCISYLVKRPIGMGIWQRLHNAGLKSHQLRLRAPLVHYARALLLACAQPAAMTSRELAVAVYYLQRREFEELPLSEMPQGNPEAVFWIPMQQDLRPFALVRRTPPDDAQVLYFSCLTFVALVEADLAALESKSSSIALPLPLRASRHLLQRLGTCWGHPRLRRFPRHRTSYRGHQCAGLDTVQDVLKRASLQSESKAARWMVTDESVNGYGLMFLRGASKEISIGNVVALQLDHWNPGTPPLVGLIRWMVSETPENLEIGMQILSPNAIPATLTHPDEPETTFPALLLPQVPKRDKAALIVPAETFSEGAADLLLCTDDATPRRIRLEELYEQSHHVDIFTFSEYAASA